MKISIPPITRSIISNGLLLTIIGMATATIIAFTFVGTAERIVEQQRLARLQALLEIIPEATNNKNWEDHIFNIADPLLGYDEIKKTAWHIIENEEINAIILSSVAPDGYTGAIELLIGIAKTGAVRGVRVVQHRETPGLGDKIELKKSDWILTFNNTSLKQPQLENWAVKRDGGYFDQFTGATVTPRAVVKAVRRSLEYASQNHQFLFKRQQDTIVNDNKVKVQ